MTKPVLVLVGPTASGKSDVAIELAVRLDGEIISADSMQIYRGMDIGTGKVPKEKRRVPHFGIDIINPGTPYSASLFQSYARSCIRDIQERKKVPILVGGTGFYVRAAIDDYDFSAGEQEGNEVRERYTVMLKTQGTDAVWQELLQRDRQSAHAIHPHNAKRVIRALEMLEYEGVSYATRLKELAHISQYISAYFYGLEVDRDILNTRIASRIEGMFAAGLVEEVQALLDAGFGEACTARDAIGYKEIVPFIQGNCNRAEARASIELATRRYAKRQRTWWRKDERVTWIQADGFDPVSIASHIADDYIEKCATK